MPENNEINYGKRVIVIIITYFIIGTIVSYFITRHNCQPTGVHCRIMSPTEILNNYDFWFVMLIWPLALLLSFSGLIFR